MLQYIATPLVHTYSQENMYMRYSREHVLKVPEMSARLHKYPLPRR